MSVGELLERISSRELTEWIAYQQLEPMQAERSDRIELLLGQLLVLLANVNRDTKKRKRPYSLEDFMPWLRGGAAQKSRQTLEQQLAIVEVLNAAFGGDDLRH